MDDLFSPTGIVSTTCILLFVSYLALVSTLRSRHVRYASFRLRDSLISKTLRSSLSSSLSSSPAQANDSPSSFREDNHHLHVNRWNSNSTNTERVEEEEEDCGRSEWSRVQKREEEQEQEVLYHRIHVALPSQADRDGETYAQVFDETLESACTRVTTRIDTCFVTIPWSWFASWENGGIRMDIDRLRLVCTHWMRRARYAQGKYSRTEFVWIILDVARALSTERTGDIHAIERNVLLQYSVSQLLDFASTLGKSIRSFTLSGLDGLLSIRHTSYPILQVALSLSNPYVPCLQVAIEMIEKLFHFHVDLVQAVSQGSCSPLEPLDRTQFPVGLGIEQIAIEPKRWYLIGDILSTSRISNALNFFVINLVQEGSCSFSPFTEISIEKSLALSMRGSVDFLLVDYVCDIHVDSSMFCCSPKLEVLSEDVENSSEIGLRLANLMEGVLSVSTIPCACMQPTGLSRSEAECVQEWICSCFEENSLVDELRMDDGNSARLNKNDWLFRRHDQSRKFRRKFFSLFIFDQADFS